MLHSLRSAKLRNLFTHLHNLYTALLGLRKAHHCNSQWTFHMRHFRTDIYSTDGSSDAASYRSVLTNWLQAENTDKTITIYGRRYSVEPGSCGVTVPSLYAPVCSAASSASSAGAPILQTTLLLLWPQCLLPCSSS